MPRERRDQPKGEFVRFSIPGAVLPESNIPVPDLIVKSYWEGFKVGMREKITRTKTKGGWVEEHWPGDLDTVSVNGSTGAFIIFDDFYSRQFTGDPALRTIPQREAGNEPDFGLATGNQVFLRRLSEASLNLESIADFYKKNGSTFGPKGKVTDVHDIEMLYMGDLYVGYFSDFNHNHSDQSPNLFTYSFTFRVKETFMESRFPEGEDFFSGASLGVRRP